MCQHGQSYSGHVWFVVEHIVTSIMLCTIKSSCTSIRVVMRNTTHVVHYKRGLRARLDFDVHTLVHAHVVEKTIRLGFIE